MIMNKYEKITPMILIIILFFLIAEFISIIFHNYNYEERVKSGNERWNQVEKRIKQIEESCNCGRNS